MAFMHFYVVSKINFCPGLRNKVYELFHEPFISDNALDLFNAVNTQGEFKFEQATIGDEPVDGAVKVYLTSTT